MKRYVVKVTCMMFVSAQSDEKAKAKIRKRLARIGIGEKNVLVFQMDENNVETQLKNLGLRECR